MMLELELAVLIVFELFVGLTDMNGEPLITEKLTNTQEVWSTYGRAAF